jgi:hypothetical protein
MSQNIESYDGKESESTETSEAEVKTDSEDKSAEINKESAFEEDGEKLPEGEDEISSEDAAESAFEEDDESEINEDSDSDIEENEECAFEEDTDEENDNTETDYSRPSHWRAGMRDEVWENAKDEHGRVRDPVSGKYMSKDSPWDMGHKPGFEFRKHQESAKERGISRKEFLDEYYNPDHYRPELPSSNRSHKGEDVTDDYFGD